VLACLQDLSQARTRWGPAAEGFLTLFAHSIILPGVADITTLRNISDLAGDIDIPYKCISRPVKLFKPGPATITTQLQRRPRLPIDAITAGHPYLTLILSRGRPYLVQLTAPAR
jgi:type IV secretory pathway TraG/TraD family ATPase VirD4